MESMLVSVHMKGTHVGKLLSMSMKWLTLGDLVSPESAMHQDVKASDLHTTKSIINVVCVCKLHAPKMFWKDAHQI